MASGGFRALVQQILREKGEREPVVESARRTEATEVVAMYSVDSIRGRVPRTAWITHDGVDLEDGILEVVVIDGFVG